MTTARKKLSAFFRSTNAALLLITAVVSVLFYSANHNFIARDNIRSIMNSMSFVGVLTIGMAMLLIGGEVDLSSGAMACFGGVFAALTTNAGIHWILSFVLTVAFGCVLGLVNALLVNKLNFMSFLATLATMGVYSGLVTVITQSKNIQVPDPGFWTIGSVTILDLFPLPFLLMIAIMAVYAVILARRPFGRAVYMIGGNRRAARLCGIDQSRVSSALYINNGALSAFAGAILASRMHTASPAAGGSGAIDAITAAVLGGVSFLGGSGAMSGCLIGILLLNIFDAGMTAVSFPSYWRIVVRGLLLVLALGLDFFGAKSRAKATEAETAR
jgi:ribose/xylose/arabinose/galactoside ABC-type transport system permease subunit